MKIISWYDFSFSSNVYPSEPHIPLVNLTSWTVNLKLKFDFNLKKLQNENLALKFKIPDLMFESDFINKTVNNISQYQEFDISLNVPNKNISFWYPNGYGTQKLYSLEIISLIQAIEITKSKSIGFRKVKLVQDSIKKFDNGLTFYFKINDLAIFLKGSNWISSNYLTLIQTEKILKAALAANMNTIRIWAGGKYESESFYDMCDRFGLIIIQSLMFDSSLYPTNTEFVNNALEEVSYQINRLKHHPSIVSWQGNNKIEFILSRNLNLSSNEADFYKTDYKYLFDKIGHKISELDESRPYIPSSPSNGDYKEIEDSNDIYFGDNHFFDTELNLWEQENFNLSRFVTEFGVQSYPSINTLKTSYTRVGDLSFSSELNNYKDHSGNLNSTILAQIKNNLAIPEKNKNDYEFFKSIIYLSQVNQAMTLKTGIEFFRKTKILSL